MLPIVLVITDLLAVGANRHNSLQLFDLCQSILKFSGGLQEEFSVSGLEGQELEHPVALFTSPDTQHIYVADAGTGRIVQLTKEGTFVRQFLPPRSDEDLFGSLRDISVDEVGGFLVALTSDGLFVAPLDQPPAALQ